MRHNYGTLNLPSITVFHLTSFFPFFIFFIARYNATTPVQAFLATVFINEYHTMRLLFRELFENSDQV